MPDPFFYLTQIKNYFCYIFSSTLMEKILPCSQISNFPTRAESNTNIAHRNHRVLSLDNNIKINL
jgi:hypothetical protein